MKARILHGDRKIILIVSRTFVDQTTLPVMLPVRIRKSIL